MKSKLSYTKGEADEIINLIKDKLKADTSRQKAIRDKIRKIGFYASDYGFRDGYRVAQFLSVAKINGKVPQRRNQPVTAKDKVTLIMRGEKPMRANSRSNSDESYIIDLCDEVLKQKAIRQYRFDFLLGDSGTRLPVDGYYSSLNLVIEFKEKQHSEAVKFFDKKQTVSGMGRGEQRKLYDQRRREVLPKNGIKLIEFDYSEYECTKSKKLARNRVNDLYVVMKKLNKYVR